MNELEAIPCKKCKHKPRVVVIDGLFYAQCSSPSTSCDKWGPYAHLGVTRAACIKNWNNANSRNTQEGLFL